MNGKHARTLFFDATIFEIPLTGVGKTTLFLYEACNKIMPEISFVGFHKGNLKNSYPRFLKFVQADNACWRKENLQNLVPNLGLAIAHFPWNGPVPFSMKIPVAMTLHDVLPLEISGYFGRNPLRRWAFTHRTQQNISRCNTIFTDSDYSKKMILTKFRVKREPVVNYFGATLEIPENSKRGNSNNSNFFVYVGGYDPRKGIMPMLKTFIELRVQKRIESRLIMTGSPNYFSDELRKLLIQSEKAGFVEQRGYVSDSELVDLYLNARGLIYLSKYEGFGLPPLEAMHVGCPVVTTMGTSLPEVCGDAVLYVDPDVNQQVANAIEALEKSQGLRSLLVEKGIKQARKFSWEKCASIFLSTTEAIEKKR